MMRLLLALVLAALAAPALAAGKSGPTGPTFVTAPAITASLMHDLRAIGVLQVQVGVMAPNEQAETRVNAAMPRLRDAYRTALARYGAGYYRRGDPPDADLIARMLQQATDGVLGPGNTVLLVAILVR